MFYDFFALFGNCFKMQYFSWNILLLLLLAITFCLDTSMEKYQLIISVAAPAESTTHIDSPNAVDWYDQVYQQVIL